MKWPLYPASWWRNSSSAVSIAFIWRARGVKWAGLYTCIHILCPKLPVTLEETRQTLFLLPTLRCSSKPELEALWVFICLWYFQLCWRPRKPSHWNTHNYILRQSLGCWETSRRNKHSYGFSSTPHSHLPSLCKRTGVNTCCLGIAKNVGSALELCLGEGSPMFKLNKAVVILITGHGLSLLTVRKTTYYRAYSQPLSAPVLLNDQLLPTLPWQPLGCAPWVQVSEKPIWVPCGKKDSPL